MRARADLREPQRLGCEFIKEHPRCNVFMPMGFGKTAAVLTALVDLDEGDPILVIAPRRVAVSVWPAEPREWAHLAHLKVAVVVGTPTERLAALKTPAHVHAINYDNIQWLMDTIPEDRWPFRTVVADECLRLKGFRLRQGTKRATRLAAIAPRTKRWINLTGTPAAQGLRDLWGPQWFIDQGAALHASFTTFENRWFYAPPRGGNLKGRATVQPHAHAEREIKAAIRPTSIAMRVEDWFDVAKPVETTVAVDLPADARAAYKRMARDLWAQIRDKTITAANAGVKSLKLLQIASGAIYHDAGQWTRVHDEKLEALESILSECNGEPVIVGYYFVHEAERIKAAFPQARELKTPGDEADWNAGKIPLLLLHPQSAGHGLSLQHGGRILVRFSDVWSNEYHMQLLERIGPMRQMQSGYDRAVLVYDIRARDTIDDVMPLVRQGDITVMDALMEHLSRV